MKVLHVTNYFPGTHAHIGGAELACLRTLRMLADHGHETVAVTTPFDLARPESLPCPVFSLPIIEGWLPKAARPYAEAVKWYALQYDPVARRAFRRLLDQERPDVVHFHNFQFLTFSLLRETARRGLPSCLSIYDYWVFCPKAQLLQPDKAFCEAGHGTRCRQCLPPQFAMLQKALLALRPPLFRRCFEKVDRFLVLSQHSARLLEDQGISTGKISVVPLTLPEECTATSSEPAPALSEKSLLFAGWLNDRKGVHIAIQALPHILRREPGAHLYIIGGHAKFSEDYEAAYQQFIAEHGLSPHLTFLGHQAPRVVLDYLRQARVLLLPEQYANMSPLIMVEAMLLGTPVVASNLGGIPEYIEDGVTGFLADAYSPEAFAEKACALLSDDAFRQSIARRAQARIRDRNRGERIWQATLDAYTAAQEKDKGQPAH